MSAALRRFVHVSGGPGAAIAIDGPAFRFEHRDRSPVWMPIDRVSEIAIQGRVALRAGVIEATLSAGIALRWLSSDGRALGALMPMVEDDPTLATRLDRLIQQPDWRLSYCRWRRRQAIWDSARALGRYSRPPDLVRALRPGLVAQRELSHAPESRRMFAAIGDVLRLDARRILVEQGWPGDRLSTPRPGPDPARDITQAMRWETLRLLRLDPVRAPLPRLVWYARHRNALRDRGRCAYDAFRRWLRDRTGPTA